MALTESMNAGDWIIALLASVGVGVLIVVFVLVVRMVFFDKKEE